MPKIAINGIGRIGRATFKILLNTKGIEVAALNDLISVENLAYLLKYDSVYGRYEGTVEIQDGNLVVDGRVYPLLHEKDPLQLPWKKMGIDLVFECTGRFTGREDLEKHVKAGARYAILSTTAKDDITTVVYGTSARVGDSVISCASCTTNCVTPVVEIIGRRVGFKKAIMTTVHAYTSSQSIVDSPSKKFPRGRAGAINFVPTSTGAARATTQVLPQYKGKFDGVAVRGPVPAGSLADINFVLERNVTAEEINTIFTEESQSDRYRGVLGVTWDPYVSSDIIRDSRASVVDLNQTQVVDGDLLKIMSWYDNEWGYSNQMVREALSVLQVYG